MSYIKFVLFDLGNVIVNVDKEEALRIFSDITGEPVEKLLDFPESNLEKNFEKGKIAIEDYVAGLKRRFNLTNEVNKEELIEIWASCFKLNEQMIELVKKIDRNIKKGILSNTNPLHIESINKNYDIFGYFDYLFFSYDFGYVKPDKRIYTSVMSKLKAKANEIIFIDDLQANLLPAEKIGFHTYLFDNPESLERYLQQKEVIGLTRKTQ
ncbi:MAG: HAD family phosphatase [Candidatus Marinimicrobia bacterium]|nr:HAD family phosphatase [Candidatus Neomarinimicrobiota bacterium]